MRILSELVFLHVGINRLLLGIPRFIYSLLMTIVFFSYLTGDLASERLVGVIMHLYCFSQLAYEN